MKAVHWLEGGQSDDEVAGVMWHTHQSQSRGGKPERVTAWKPLLQSDLLEIQDPSNVAQQLCRLLIQIVSE